MPEAGFANRDDNEPRSPDAVRSDVDAELQAMKARIKRLEEEKRGRLPGVETK